MSGGQRGQYTRSPGRGRLSVARASPAAGPIESHAPIAQRDVRVVADDQVVEQLDVEQSACCEGFGRQVEVVRRTTLRIAQQLSAVVSLEQILEVQKLVIAAPVSDHVIDYAVRLAAATRPANPQAPEVTRSFVEWGAGPRASQYLVLGAKAVALLAGKVAAETSDVREVALPVLQHRVITNYRATGAGKKSRDIVKELVAQVQEKNY